MIRATTFGGSITTMKSFLSLPLGAQALAAVYILSAGNDLLN
ncbi:MAG: hypothetical protein ACOH5I_25010 [Oligoflexus sp.]